jgi:hypothetical protein
MWMHGLRGCESTDYKKPHYFTVMRFLVFNAWRVSLSTTQQLNNSTTQQNDWKVSTHD